MKKNKVKRKTNFVLLGVLCFIIFIMVIGDLLLNKYYISKNEFSYDYLTLKAKNYEEIDNTKNISNKDRTCYITLKTEITDEIDILDFGTKIKINDKDWARQDFENGETWFSYNNKSLYIIQMYGKNKSTYDKRCKKEFENITKTFKFVTHE